MTLADSVILGIAPLGLMAIIVSAIRVGGNRFMKSLIGRARDSPDDEEKEILSSTSDNVREVWNGHRIIRQTGESKTVILVFDPHQVNEEGPCLRSLCNQKSYKPPESVFGSKKVKLLEKNLLLGSSQEQAGFHWYLDELGDNHQTSFPMHRLLWNISPNLTTNLDGAIPNQWMVVIFSLVGLLAQGVVMAINAIAVYHWKWPRAGKAIGNYGYPTWAAGTMGITIGTCICGWVVESSSWKISLTESSSNPGEKKPRIILLQKKISELNTPTYSIMPTQPGGLFRISRRVWPPSSDGIQGTLTRREAKKRSILTIVGASITLVGFLCQNIGTRELHWSAGVLQLGLTLLLTIARAWLRRRVGNGLYKGTRSRTENISDNMSKSDVIELNPGFESCNLTTRIIERYCYIPSAVGRTPSLLSPRELLSSENTKLGLPTDTRQICWVPMIDYNEIGKLKRGSRYDSIVNNILKSQALLAGFEPDAENIVTLAAGCARAMKACLKIICNAADPYGHSRNIELHQLRCISHMLVADSYPGDGCSKPNAMAMVRVPQYSAEISNSDARYVQAIISLTRYTYRDMIIRDSRGTQKMGVWRILGHCRFDDAPDYLALLSRWISKDRLSVRRIQEDGNTRLEEPVYLPENLQDSGGSRRLAVVFGLSFSHAFDVQLSSAEDKEPLDVDSDVNEQGTLMNGDYECELVVQDPENKKHVEFVEALDRNIVHDLISSFLFRVSREYGEQFTTFLGYDEGKPFKELVDILVEQKVCSSEEDGWLAVAPIILDRKCLRL